MLEADATLISYGELLSFANSLYGYLYFQFGMQNNIVNTSDHFRDNIGLAVLYFRQITRKCNTEVLEKCGIGVDRRTLCDKICKLYSDDDYFKKLYYVSAFIMDMMFWEHSRSQETNLSLGPHLWIMVFRNHFENKFELHGGWKELAVTAPQILDMLRNETVLSESILPTRFLATIRTFNWLKSVPDEESDTDEFVSEFQILSIKKKSGLVSVAEVPRIVVSKAEIELNQPRDEQNPEKLQPENEQNPEKDQQPEDEQNPEKDQQPKKIHGKRKFSSNPNSPEFGEVQAKEPRKVIRGKSGESQRSSLTRQNLRKRRHEIPNKTDSEPEEDSTSPSKPKVDRR